MKLHPIFLFCLIIGVQAILTPNLLLTLVALACLLVIYKLFWNENEPNPLFFGLFMQWVVSCIELLYCNFWGITLKEKYILQRVGFGMPDLLDYTVYLSLYGIIAFSFGIWIITRNIPLGDLQKEFFIKYNLQKLILLYIAYSTFAAILNNYVWIFAGLSQPLLQVINFRYALLFFLVFLSLNRKKHQAIVFFIVLIEIIMGLFSFFAGSLVKIFLVTGMAIVSAKPKFSIRYQLFVSIFVSILLIFGVVWSAIKKEYRIFLNKGQISQTVLVSRDEALQNFSYLVRNLDAKDIQQGSVTLVNRLGYIAFFSNTIAYVPRNHPHENGQVYLGAFGHFLIPRFFYPNKPAIDDSKHTQKYTGLVISGRESATSISLGYLADAYIDFGPIGMFFPLLMFGIFVGTLYRYFYLSAPNPAWSWMLTIPFFFLTNINGMDAIKAVGAVIIYGVIFYFLKNYLFKFIDPIISHK